MESPTIHDHSQIEYREIGTCLGEECGSETATKSTRHGRREGKHSSTDNVTGSCRVALLLGEGQLYFCTFAI